MNNRFNKCSDLEIPTTFLSYSVKNKIKLDRNSKKIYPKFDTSLPQLDKDPEIHLNQFSFS